MRTTTTIELPSHLQDLADRAAVTWDPPKLVGSTVTVDTHVVLYLRGEIVWSELITGDLLAVATRKLATLDPVYVDAIDEPLLTWDEREL